MTMNARICVAFVLILVTGATALAAQDTAPTSHGLFSFKGTPQEQAACSPDAARFCSDAIPDTFRVLACLQEHREKLRKACRQVLEDHGE
jgi:Cysteine rich repeat